MCISRIEAREDLVEHIFILDRAEFQECENALGGV